MTISLSRSSLKSPSAMQSSNNFPASLAGVYPAIRDGWGQTPRSAALFTRTLARFCNHRQTSVLFRLSSIIFYLQPHGRRSRPHRRCWPWILLQINVQVQSPCFAPLNASIPARWRLSLSLSVPTLAADEVLRYAIAVVFSLDTIVLSMIIFRRKNHHCSVIVMWRVFFISLSLFRKFTGSETRSYPADISGLVAATGSP